MERISKNINAALSQVASAVTIDGNVPITDLEKRILSAIGQLEEAKVNIDELKSILHFPTIELHVREAEETPSKEYILDAWEQHCRSHRQNFIPAVAVIMGRHQAEVRANDGTKLGIYDYASKQFK